MYLWLILDQKIMFESSNTRASDSPLWVFILLAIYSTVSNDMLWTCKFNPTRLVIIAKHSSTKLWMRDLGSQQAGCLSFISHKDSLRFNLEEHVGL